MTTAAAEPDAGPAPPLPGDGVQTGAAWTDDRAADGGSSALAVLTGIRTGKRSFYPAYLRSAERLEQAVQALDGISRALVRTAAGPRALVESVVRAVAGHLRARQLLFVVADGVLPAARPRFLAMVGSQLIDDERQLPVALQERLAVMRGRPWETEPAAPGSDWVGVVMILDDEAVGGIAVLPGAGLEVADTDRAVVRVLANQAAVALHNSFLFHATTQLRGRSEQLFDVTTQHARDLAARSAELAQTQAQLLSALQRQALDDERHRMARELHDSVTQSVLSVGMTIEVCRAELAAIGGDAAGVADRLGPLRDLTRHAAEQLRASIYALHQAHDEPDAPLPLLLERLSSVHQLASLAVQVRVSGPQVALPPAAGQALLRWTGEALFNAASHGKATRATVALRYLPGRVTLSVSDNGAGDPAQLRRALRLSCAADLSGRHRGLANMQAMAEELGGTLAIRKATAGGVCIRMSFPRPASGEA